MKQHNRGYITSHSSSKTKDSNILYVTFLHSNVQTIGFLLYIFSCVLALSQMFPVQSNLSFYTIQLFSFIWSPVAVTSGETWGWRKEVGEFYSTWHIMYYLICEHIFLWVAWGWDRITRMANLYSPMLLHKLLLFFSLFWKRDHKWQMLHIVNLRW